MQEAMRREKEMSNEGKCLATMYSCEQQAWISGFSKGLYCAYLNIEGLLSNIE